MSKQNVNKSNPPTKSSDQKKANEDKSKRGAGKPYTKQGRDRQGNVRREQPKKDSKSKRMNYDNAREDRVAKQIEKDAHSGKFNDVNDFLRNPTLLKAAASFPVAPILGMRIGEAHPVPGVMQFVWIPNFGNYICHAPEKVVSPIDDTKSVDLTPPPVAMNQSSDSTYSFVMHANSRTYNWTASDLNILTQAGVEVFAMINAMKRAFGLTRTIQEQTLYKPKAILSAMGFIYDDLRDNLGKAWWDLNNLIVQTRQIWIPNVFPILNRRIEMNSNLYKDATGDYAQIYVFTQGRYFIYDATATRSGGGLKTLTEREGTNVFFTPGAVDEDMAATGSQGHIAYKWEDWVKNCQRMIDALVNSEDRGNIYGNLLAAYGSDRIVALPEVEDGYRVEPQYSPEISMQIENIRIMKESFAPIGLAQFADKLYPVYRDATGATGQGKFDVSRQHILNFHVESDPTPEMILLATRYQPLGMFKAAFPKLDNTTDLPKVGRNYVPYTAGSEIIVQSSIVGSPDYSKTQPSNHDNAYLLVYDPNTFHYVMGNDWATTTSSEIQSYWMNAMAFDWHPFATLAGTVTAAKDPGALTPTTDIQSMGVWPTQYFGDFDRYSWSELSIVKQLNDTAEYSLWGVPQI